MHSPTWTCWLVRLLGAWTLVPLALLAQRLPENWRLADRELGAYFDAEVQRIESACLTDVHTLADWEAQRGTRREELLDALGLWPLPERTPLQAVVTGTLEGDGFTVEKLHFQSQPGLYVTANLYLPRDRTRAAPAVLYVCGHSEVKTNGVSYGNKTHYQHHGASWARNGYVCLVLDTLQLGEIQGDHHGTYRLAQWWWNSRGYTPAGVEAWNGIRALDYLETRPEVDRTRIGMTGRSGGGSYTWTTAAIDERIRVAAPVAGITDLRNQVCDGSVEGHCDCMFFVNTHRWDFALNAALMAPRPLLIVNTDADSLFPLDGVQRLFAQTRRIYSLYDAYDQLGLVIGPGPHADTQNLQVPVLRWFNQHLKGTDPFVSEAPPKLLAPEQLRVFASLPTDQRNTRAQEFFGAPAGTGSTDLATLRQQLRTQVFGGWPEDPGPLALRELSGTSTDRERLREFEFTSQPHVTLRLQIARQPNTKPSRVRFLFLDDAGWSRWSAAVAENGSGNSPIATAEPAIPRPTEDELIVGFAPRGWGPHRWAGDARKQIQIRRRFPLVGQTVDGMRVWDLRRALQAAREATGLSEFTIVAGGGPAILALYAAALADSPPPLELHHLPATFRDEPDLLNVAQVTDTAHVLELLQKTTRVSVK